MTSLGSASSSILIPGSSPAKWQNFKFPWKLHVSMKTSNFHENFKSVWWHKALSGAVWFKFNSRRRVPSLPSSMHMEKKSIRNFCSKRICSDRKHYQLPITFLVDETLTNKTLNVRHFLTKKSQFTTLPFNQSRKLWKQIQYINPFGVYVALSLAQTPLFPPHC